MRKLAFITLFLLTWAASFSQMVVPRSSDVLTAEDFRIMAGYNFFAPRYIDTTAANLQKGIDSCGALIFTYNTNGFWYRQCSPKKWVQVLSTSNSVAGSNTQIQYNDNGAFGASSGLTWTNASNRLTTGGDAVFGGVRIGHGPVPAITDNIVVGGNGALTGITTGFGNSAFGSAALSGVSTGSYNTAVGSGAGFVLTTGQRNTSIGWGTLFEGGTVSTSFNTLVGFYAGRHIAGSTNTGLGYQVYGGQFGSPAQTGTNNNAFGANTGGALTSGNYNILIGDDAGANLTTGSNNIAIGQAGQFAGATASNQLNIQNIIYGINNSATGATASTGNIGIGTAAPDSMLTVEWGVHVKRGILAGTISTSAFQYTDGNQANGYVLTSDVSGNASWQPAAAGSQDLESVLDINNTASLPIFLTSNSALIRISNLLETQSAELGTDGASAGSGYLKLLNSSGFSGSFRTNNLTANRLWEMPNAAGTVALTSSNITGSAGTLNPGRQIGGVAFDGSANIGINPKILAYQALGSTIIATNIDGDLSSGGNGQALTDARVYYSAVYLDKAQTVTGAKWVQITAGDYTADAYNGVALCTYSGGNLTVVASSTNDGNIWKATTGTMSSKAFSATYSASAGLYFVAYLYNSSAQVTAPSLGIINTASSINTITDFTNSAKTSALLSTQASFPSPQAMSGLTAASTEYKAFLY